MGAPSEDTDFPVIKYSAAKADAGEINALIAKAWSAALSDPAEKQEIAGLLEVKPTDLNPQQPPFRAKMTGSGLTGGEVLIAFAAGFAIGFAKDMGSAAGKALAKKLRELWTRYLSNRVNAPGTDALGDSKDEVGEG